MNQISQIYIIHPHDSDNLHIDESPNVVEVEDILEELGKKRKGSEHKSLDEAKEKLKKSLAELVDSISTPEEVKAMQKIAATMQPTLSAIYAAISKCSRLKLMLQNAFVK